MLCLSESILKIIICSSDQGPELQGTKTSPAGGNGAWRQASSRPPHPGSWGSAGSEGTRDTLRQPGCWVN